MAAVNDPGTDLRDADGALRRAALAILGFEDGADTWYARTGAAEAHLYAANTSLRRACATLDVPQMDVERPELAELAIERYNRYRLLGTSWPFNALPRDLTDPSQGIWTVIAARRALRARPDLAGVARLEGDGESDLPPVKRIVGIRGLGAALRAVALLFGLAVAGSVAVQAARGQVDGWPLVRALGYLGPLLVLDWALRRQARRERQAWPR